MDPAKERERGLTGDGRKLVEAVAETMVGADELPKVIFSSPFVRAVQTSDIIGKRLEISVNVVGDLSPDRPLEDALLGFMAHQELKRVLIVGHVDNTSPAFNKFGGDMRDCVVDGDDVDGDELFWPALIKGEIRRVAIHREFGYWRCRWRLRPSDLGFTNEE